MPKQKRIKTDYPGVFYIEGKRKGRPGTERIYYIVFKHMDANGRTRTIEEKAGRQYVDEMTPRKASLIRAERIEGKRKAPKEIRQEQIAAQQAEQNRPTIARMWERYIDREDRPIKGLAQDRSRFKKYLEPVVGDREPTEITELEVQKIARSIKKLSVQTRAHVWRLLRRIVRAEAGEEVWKAVAKDAGIDKRMPKRINNQVENQFSDELLSRYMAAVEADYDPVTKAVIKLAMFTGMRRGEILSLRWQDIDLQAGFILLPDTKGGRPERVPLSPQVIEVLEQIPRTENDLLFPGRKGKVRPDLKRGIKRVKDRAGLPQEYRPLHDLRHNFATRLASSGKVDIYLLQRLLCHKDPKTTQRYAHLVDKARKDAAALAGDLFSEALKGEEQVEKLRDQSV